MTKRITDLNYFQIKNWEQFQQYKDRDPKWIKLHRDLLDNYEFDLLDEVAQIHLMKIWLLAAKLGNKIPNDPAWIARKIGAKSEVDIKQLVTSGFLVPYQSVQECTEKYSRAGTRSPEKEKEEYKEETERAGTRKPQKRGFRLPTKWEPSKHLTQWAMKERTDLDIQKVIDSFTDHWKAKTGSNATKLDWDATFRNWVRNEHTNNRQPRRHENALQRSDRIAEDRRAEILAGH